MGDEVLKGCSLADAVARVEGIRQAVVSRPWPGPGRLTVSARVAAFPDDGRTPGELLSAADSRLYRAKRDGRDRVVTT
ncbi:MAG: diguanylate cyclase [Bacillota bacterium]